MGLPLGRCTLAYKLLLHPGVLVLGNELLLHLSLLVHEGLYLVLYEIIKLRRLLYHL